MKIAVIGTGRVGGTLGTAWAKHGYEIVFGTRDPSSSKVRSLIKLTDNKATAATAKDAVTDADVIVVATPWHATEATVRPLANLKNWSRPSRSLFWRPTRNGVTRDFGRQCAVLRPPIH